MSQYIDKEFLKAISVVSKEFRKDKNVTQETVNNDIREASGVAFHIGRIETGQSNFSISTLLLLCEYYKVTLSDFFKRVEEVRNSK